MQFDSLEAALQMGGHGPYVWSVYLVSLLVVLALLLGPVLRARRISRRQRILLRQQRALQSVEGSDAPGS